MIDNDKWTDLAQLLSRDHDTSPSEIAVQAFLRWKGININKNVEHAKNLINQSKCDNDGRC